MRKAFDKIHEGLTEALAFAAESVTDWWPPYFWLGAEADSGAFRHYEFVVGPVPSGVWRSYAWEPRDLLPSELLRQARVAAKWGVDG